MGESPFLQVLPPPARQDPYPLYDRMLTEVPVSDGPDGMTVVTRHADCARLLRDPELSSDYTNGSAFQQQVAAGALSEMQLAETDQRWFVFRDPPDHTRLRRLASKAFIPRTEYELRRRVQVLVSELLEQAVGAGEGNIEFVEDFALPLPMQIIGEVMGTPSEDHARMHEWSQAIARQMDPPAMLTAEEHQLLADSHSDMTAYFDAQIEQRRSQPGDDLITRLLAAEESGDQLTAAEVNSICRIMLVAGHLTTVNLLANGMLALLRNPDELSRLRSEPGLAETAVDEVLRYDPPMHYLLRIALEDTELDGHTLRAGHPVVLLVAAANRDPERFTYPQRFDVGRTDNPHLSFGAGIHRCIAAWLARLEGQVAFATLARRMVEPELLDSTPPYRPHVSIRGLESLPIRVRDLKPA